MAITYAVGNIDGPGKKKKVNKGAQQPPLEGKKASEASKEARMKQFDSKDQKRVSTSIEIANNTTKALDKGLKLNDHGIPDGAQKHKKFSIQTPVAPKFRK